MNVREAGRLNFDFQLRLSDRDDCQLGFSFSLSNDFSRINFYDVWM